MATYCFGLRHCADEPMLAKYYPPGAREFPLDLISACIPAVPAAANTVAAIQVRFAALFHVPSYWSSPSMIEKKEGGE